MLWGMRRPTLIILACISFILGIILGYFFIFEITLWWWFFVVAAIASLVIVKRPLKLLPVLCLGLVCGVCVTTSYLTMLSVNSITRFQYQKVKVTGEVKGDPYWDSDHNYIFVLTNPMIDNQHWQGEVRVKTFSGFAQEGNMVQVKGRLFPILAKPGFQISYATVDIVSSTQPLLVGIKQIFYKGLEASLPEPATGFTKGILLGARSSLPKDVQDTMNSVGLSHIVAVSGYNLTILVVLLQKVLKRRWRWGSLVISIGLIVVFTIISGASASIVRAAIMATIFLLASYYGRDLSILVCIGITAVITLVANPTAAMDDLGWQLSFLSLTGIVVLSPVILRLLPKRTRLVSELLAVTLSAQIATVPFILYIFGQYSLVAIVANVVVMPLIPLLMASGFIAGVLGLLLPYSAYIVASPLNFLIGKILELLRYLQSFHGFIVTNKPTLSILFGWYSVLCVIGTIQYHKGLNRPETFKIPDQMIK